MVGDGVLEHAVAIAEQHLDRACRGVVRHGEIELAVAVPVARHQPLREGAGAVEGRRHEGPGAAPDENADRARRAVVSAGEIDPAVAVPVPGGDARGMFRRGTADAVGVRGSKAAVGAADKQAHGAGRAADDRQVRLAVAVPVPLGQDGVRLVDSVAGGAAEAPAAVADENPQVVSRRGEVDLAVAVPVARRDRGRSAGRFVDRRSLEGPVAVAEENAQATAGHREVHLPIAIPVTDLDGNRAGTRRVSDRRREGPVALAEEHADALRAEAGDDQIDLRVAVEIARLH